MTDDQLINFYDRHKAGSIYIYHPWTAISPGNTSITLADLFKAFKLVYEQENEKKR